MRGKPENNRRIRTVIAGALGALAVAAMLSGTAGAQPGGDGPEAISADAQVIAAPAPLSDASNGGPWDVPAHPPNLPPGP